MVKKIKVYDIKGMVANLKLEQDGKTLATHLRHQFAIIEGSKGVLLFCEEGVGDIFDDMKQTIKIELSPSSENSISIFPTAIIEPSLEEIVSNASYEEVEFKDAIRKFGARLEQNFHIQLDGLEKVGLKQSDYYSGGR